MNDDYKRFAVALGELAVCYGRGLDAATIRAYWRVLGAYGVDNLVQAMLRCTQLEKFWPTPAAILAYVPGNLASVAAAVWRNLGELADERGSLASLRVDDPAAVAALDSLGGWIAFCNMDQKYESLRRKDFIDSYMESARSGRSGDARTYAGRFGVDKDNTIKLRGGNSDGQRITAGKVNPNNGQGCDEVLARSPMQRAGGNRKRIEGLEESADQ